MWLTPAGEERERERDAVISHAIKLVITLVSEVLYIVICCVYESAAFGPLGYGTALLLCLRRSETSD